MINNGAVLWQSEQAWSWIAGLRFRRDGADFYKAEAQCT